MERLTEKHFAEKGYYLKCSEMCEEMNCSFCEHDSDALDKLGEYEDAEDQKLIVRLPCKLRYVAFGIRRANDSRMRRRTDNEQQPILRQQTSMRSVRDYTDNVSVLHAYRWSNR